MIVERPKKDVKYQIQKEEEDELLGELNSNEGEDEYHSILDNNVPTPKASEKVKYVTNKEDYEILNELEENKNEQNEANIDISSEQIEKGLDELEDIEYEIDEDEKDEELIVEEIKADKVFGEDLARSVTSISVVEVMKNRLQNYVKAIEFCKKYDAESINKLLQTAEKLKKLEIKSKGGIKVDRFSLVSEGIDDLTPQVISEKLFCASEGQRK